MGRLLRRLKGTAPRELELPLSTYGKLPFYKDFLRTGLSGVEVKELRAWLDRGISHHWGPDPAYREVEIPAYALLTRFNPSQRALAAYLWGSHDDGRLRHFPFTVLTVLPPPRGAFGTLAALDALAQVAAAGAALREALAAVESTDEFYRVARGRTARVVLRSDADVRRELHHTLSAITLEELAVSLRPPADAAAAAALPPRLRELAARPEPPLAVRLPVSSALPAIQQAQLWWLLSGDGSRRAAAHTVLVAPDALDAGIVLLERPLRPDDVFLLHPAREDAEAVEDLRRPPAAGAPCSSAAPVASWLGERED